MMYTAQLLNWIEDKKKEKKEFSVSGKNFREAFPVEIGVGTPEEIFNTRIHLPEGYTVMYSSQEDKFICSYISPYRYKIQITVKTPLGEYASSQTDIDEIQYNDILRLIENSGNLAYFMIEQANGVKAYLQSDLLKNSVVLVSSSRYNANTGVTS